MRDLAGREVVIPRQPRAVLLGESSQLLNMVLLHPDPVSLLVGMGGDLRVVDPASHAALGRRFPRLEQVPEVSAGVGQTVSTERALSLQPDLVILALWQQASEEVRRMVELLGAAGVPVVFVDLFLKPIAHTLPTIRLLGQALGREEAAEAYARFYEARL
ncbi:ABC transporter substrate-binding protein [Roseomonas sp. OT10]|uniref:ABC transporter substrate-binding protein n=1 Tax=Roseomonas cutis TaxID=2897332 RepID=UPI001E444E51|nr:ABC transporter substrate-binding protein [Roseomonas sp. OT10]UFN51252.1 ABC transporter substrate-binding protein [Roseomonas sp. OT10]